MRDHWCSLLQLAHASPLPPPSPAPIATASAGPQVRSESLSYAPRLFVTDGALAAGSRASELRVRFVTDCPLVALASRALLHRIPLYAPEAFPRTLTVYAATLAAQEGVAAGASLPGAASASGGRVAYSMVDVDPQAARGTVTTVGAVPLAGVFGAIATAASALQVAGGYRHIPGGAAQSPNMNKARAGELQEAGREGGRQGGGIHHLLKTVQHTGAALRTTRPSPARHHMLHHDDCRRRARLVPA